MVNMYGKMVVNTQDILTEDKFINKGFSNGKTAQN
jgi:hypothetical protein